MKKEKLDKISVYSASVFVNGEMDTIYNHINKSLRTTSGDKVKHTPNVSEAEFFVVGGVELNMSYLTCYAKMLWIKFFKENEFEKKIAYDIKDMRILKKEPYDSVKLGIINAMKNKNMFDVVEGCREFIDLLKENSLSVYINDSTFDFPEGTLIHPVSCDGKFNDVVSKIISKHHTEIIKSHELRCKQAGYGRMNMGKYTLEELGPQKSLLSVFCIESVSREFLEDKHLKRALLDYKEVNPDAILIIPHKLGYNLSDIEWGRVVAFINENFSNPKYL